MNEETNLSGKIYELRDLINSSILYKQDAWKRKDNGGWDKLWTAVDNVEDTQSAIEEYSALKDFSRLAVYGLLQAMVVQQDAIKHLEEAIKIKVVNYKIDYPDLFKIREIRNETVGHPTDTRRKDKSVSYTSISPTKNLDVLEYGVWHANNFEHKTINLKEIIKTQHDLLVAELSRIIKKIKNDEAVHKEQFKNQNLSETLKMTSYYIQKLWPFERDRHYSESMFKLLSDALNQFKEETKKRYNIDNFAECVNIPGVVDVVEKIEKLSPRVEEMLPMGKGVDILDLEVYVESLSKAFDSLRTMAREVDEEFVNNKS